MNGHKKILECISDLREGIDLTAADAVYHRSCYAKMYFKIHSGFERGHQTTSDVDKAMEFIYSCKRILMNICSQFNMWQRKLNEIMFDQLFYLKASDIVSSQRDQRLNNVIIRL